MGFNIKQIQSFNGSAIDLAREAMSVSYGLNLTGDHGKINERLVRYYVTEGLVNRPNRVGRDAEYGYLHLLQFLAGRFLVDEGFPMAKVGPYLTELSMAELENIVVKQNKPNLAEILVASYKKPKDQYDIPAAYVRRSPKESSKRQTSVMEVSMKSSTKSMDDDIFSSFDHPQIPSAKELEKISNELSKKLNIQLAEHLNEIVRSSQEDSAITRESIFRLEQQMVQLDDTLKNIMKASHLQFRELMEYMQQRDAKLNEKLLDAIAQISKSPISRSE